MRVYLGADHRGFELKEEIKKFLQTDHEIIDCGAYELNPNDDYPEFAKTVAEEVSTDENSRGIIICGSGVGVDIVANRFEGVRSGLAINTGQIKSAREDDNINVLAIAADSTDPDKAWELVKIFLQTEFENSENHVRRIEEIDQLS